MKTVTLNSLSVGEKFKLKTKRFFLRNHIYEIVKKDQFVYYKFHETDKYNQVTITTGKEMVIPIK